MGKARASLVKLDAHYTLEHLTSPGELAITPLEATMASTGCSGNCSNYDAAAATSAAAIITCSQSLCSVKDDRPLDWSLLIPTATNSITNKLLC